MDRIGHLVLGTPDVVKTANFYQEVFGLCEADRKHEPEAGDNPPDQKLHRLYLSDGNMNLTISTLSKECVVGMYMIGFVVDYMDETRDRLKAAGAQFVHSSTRNRHHHFEFKYMGPEGVPIVLAQRGWRRQTVEGVKTKLQHVAVGTPDVVKTANFYKEAFGLRETERKYEPGAGANSPDDMVRRLYLWDGQVNLTICKVPTLGLYHFGFLVDNIDKSRQRMEAAGCSLLQGGPWRPGGHDEYKYRGPDGVIIDTTTHGWGPR